MRRIAVIYLTFWELFLFGQPSPPNGESDLPTLLIFSGSDWCLPCIRLEREIFSTQEFKDFARGRVHIVKADFPQKKKLNDSLLMYNEALARQYNPSGAFPRVVLLQQEKTKQTIIPTESINAEQFLHDLRNLLAGENREYRKKALLMGSSFEFVIVSNDPATAQKLLWEGEQEVRRLEDLLSEWKTSTEISRVNHAAGVSGVEVSPETFQLTQRALALSAMTQGAFDISFHGMDIYEFDQEPHLTFPDSALVKERLKNIDYQKVKLEEGNKIFLSDSGMAIGFGACGKGFAADEVRKIWQDKGVRSGVVNASGDLVAWGTRADGSPWKVGIANPEDPKEILFWIPLKDQAVATSGSYEKYFEYNNQRYSHIINPITGFPVTDKKSVTVISPSAELSDALATALFVMDVETGLDLIRQLPQTDCIIIDADHKVHFSTELKLIN